MPYDPDRHHRRSVRLQAYDYSQAGAYFITICLQTSEGLFGNMVSAGVELSESGSMVDRWWQELPHKFPTIEIDEHVIMPNHFHGIVVLAASDTHPGPASAPVSRTSLSTVVQWFKTMTTNGYIRGVKEAGWPPFHGKLWQRDYYEHVIRDEQELDRIRDYIVGNPGRWLEDRLHPLSAGGVWDGKRADT